jgi:hypothetical protein
MTERPLLPQERALISASVAFCVLPAAGQPRADRFLLLRLMTLCDAVADMAASPLKSPRFEIEHGPVQHIYWAARELIKLHRDKAASRTARECKARHLACHVFTYFDTRSILGLRGLSLAEHVPEPPKAVVI